MPITRNGWRGIVLGAVLAVGLATVGWAPAWAADQPISAFFGQWRGAGLSESEISVHFQVSARDLDVRIQPAGTGGFTITWTTIQRQKGAAGAPEAVNKGTTMTFLPEGKPNVFRAQGSADPLKGPFAWARIQDRTLTVHSLEIAADGGFELQVYDRTLTGSGMELNYTRTKDGDQVRTARARLIKYAK